MPVSADLGQRDGDKCASSAGDERLCPWPSRFDHIGDMAAWLAVELQDDR